MKYIEKMARARKLLSTVCITHLDDMNLHVYFVLFNISSKFLCI